MAKIGFIGCGNMGGALCSALAKEVEPKDVYAADYIEKKADEISRKIGVNKSTNEEIAQNCDFIFLAVKPQNVKETIDEIKDILKSRKKSPIIVSMAAGTDIESIEKMLGGKVPVIRIMPNTPAKIGQGVIVYDANELVSWADAEDFEAIMKKAGMIDRIPEKLIDAASAVSGCGPAFVYMFIEALSDGAVNCGLPRDKALLYAAKTVSGAAQMVIEAELHPAALKDAVCSPGGTTIEGVKALEDGAFRASAMNAVIKAYEKTLKLK